jgi:hypothetical protein
LHRRCIAVPTAPQTKQSNLTHAQRCGHHARSFEAVLLLKASKIKNKSLAKKHVCFETETAVYYFL